MMHCKHSGDISNRERGGRRGGGSEGQVMF